MLPFDHNRLTEPEKATQKQQEKQTCLTCSNAQIHQRGGARVCMEPEAPDTRDVLAKLVICEHWK